MAWKPLTFITKCSILDVAAARDSLLTIFKKKFRRVDWVNWDKEIRVRETEIHRGVHFFYAIHLIL